MISNNIVQAFTKDVAHRYNIPELLLQPWHRDYDHEVENKIFTTGTFNSQPTGQLSGFVKSLRVKLTLYQGKDSKEVGYEISFDYNHIDPGSNGKKQTGVLNIAPESMIDKEQYLGFIDYFALHNLIRTHGKA